MNIRKICKMFTMAALLGVLGLSLANPAFASSKTAKAANTASASSDLYRFIPSGIDPINDVHATQQVVAYAKNNPAYGQALASQTGDTSFAPSAYKADGYRPHAPAGSTNSAAGADGQVVGMADHGNSATVKVVAIINVHTMQVAYVMVRCGNLRLMRVTPLPWKPIHIGVSATINRMVTKNASITCPSGQKVTGYVTTRVKGVIYAQTRGKVKGWAKIWLRQRADLQIKTTLKLKCGPAPKPPTPKTCTDTKASNFGGPLPCQFPPPPPPTVTYTASATATASASATCPDGTTATASASGSGYATSTVSQDDANQRAQAQAQANAQANATASIKCGSGPPPPPTCTPSIVSVTTINDVDAGGNSPNFKVTVNMCGSNTGTLIVSAKYGSFQSGTVTASGANTYTFTYVAPTEVPPGGTDTVTVSLRDNVTGLSATQNVQSFPINPPPPSP